MRKLRLTTQLTDTTISELTGLLGLIFSLIGTSIGVFNFWRDKGKLVVRLQWDMARKAAAASVSGPVPVQQTSSGPFLVPVFCLSLAPGTPYNEAPPAHNPPPCFGNVS